MLCVLGAVSLWLLRSSLVAVYGDLGDMATVDPRWLLAIVGCEVVAFVWSWDLNRLALRTDRWFDVAVAQLSGNAATNLVPAGGAAGAAVQLRVLSEAGFDLTRAAASLGALSVLGAVGFLMLPVLALPFAIAAGPAGGRLEGILWLGMALLAVCLVVIAVLVTRDGPLERIASVVQWVRNRLWRSRPRQDLPVRVLAERDSITAAIRERPGRVVSATIGRTAADFAALYISLLAVGVHPSLTVVLIAFGTANVAGMIPFTPGGLGFVEAGITGTLAAAGIDPAHAALAAALYRFANTWLPVLAGLVGYGVFRRRHGRAELARAGHGGHGPIDPLEAPLGLSVTTDVVGRRASRRRFRTRQLITAVITVVALALVSPVLVKVYGHIGETFALGPGWLLAIAAVIVAHFMIGWALYRVILRTSNRFDVAASQLAANATSHVSPAGSAVGAGIQLRMLTIAGFPASRAATALGATALLGTVAGYIVLPLSVLLTSALTGGIPSSLVDAMWVATGLLTVLLLAAIALAVRDEPWLLIAHVVAWAQRRLHRESDPHELGERLLHERDLVQAAIRDRAGLVVMLAILLPLTDYIALYLALLAVGARINPASVMAAFVVSNIAGLIPLTPGGLGFVEAGLGRVITLAGATHLQAHVAIVTYRLAATWLPCVAGFVALVLFQRRHRGRRRADESQGAAKLADTHELTRADDATPRLAPVEPQVLAVLHADGIADHIGVDHIHGNVHRAVAAQLADATDDTDT